MDGFKPKLHVAGRAGCSLYAAFLQGFGVFSFIVRNSKNRPFQTIFAEIPITIATTQIVDGLFGLCIVWLRWQSYFFEILTFFVYSLLLPTLPRKLTI